MRETEFRAFLAPRLGGPSVDSYVAYCRRVARTLGVDLDSCDLTQSGLRDLADRLHAADMPDKSVRNSLSALRAYASFSSGSEASPSLEPRTRRPMEITPEQRRAWEANTAGSAFNRWLDAQCRDPAGQLDLERLHALALQYGIDKRQDYAALNPGQQRMNIGNQLRRVVPPSAYDAIAPDAETPGTAPRRRRPAPPAVPPEVRAEVRAASTGDLLALYGEILDELRHRGVVRTGNSPVGDYAELLFARAFGWSLAPNSASGHDASDADGRRFQIKSRRLRHPKASRQLSAIRRLNDKTFDDLAALLFDPACRVTHAIIIPYEVVARRARRVEHTNSWTFILDDSVWDEPGVTDVTRQVSAAGAAL